jgi:hypothetical protein
MEVRVREKPRVRLSTAHNHQIDEFAERQDLPKTAALEALMDLVFSLEPIYEKHSEELHQLGKVRGKSEVEMLALVVQVGLEALPAYESAIAERQEKIRALFQNQGQVA